MTVQTKPKHQTFSFWYSLSLSLAVSCSSRTFLRSSSRSRSSSASTMRPAIDHQVVYLTRFFVVYKVYLSIRYVVGQKVGINNIAVHTIKLTFSDHIIQLFLKLSILVIYVSHNSLLECAIKSLGRTIRINPEKNELQSNFS